MHVEIIPIPNFENRANGIVKIDLNHLKLPIDFVNKHQIILSIPPRQFGGNHKHGQREVFVSLSDDLELHWIDEKGMTHIHKMKEGNQLYLFDVHPFVPHAIMNVSYQSSATLLELADDCKSGLEVHKVL